MFVIPCVGPCNGALWVRTDLLEVSIVSHVELNMFKHCKDLCVHIINRFQSLYKKENIPLAGQY